ncbi:hypothetical protein MTO96_008456 [Rhipicephalus appendiculatus]
MSFIRDIDVTRRRFARLRKDVKDLTRNPPPGIYAAPEENDITRLYALVAPTVRFLTTDAGRVWLHPYLYESGEVSLSILGTFSGPQWSPGLSLGSLLVSIQSLLTDNPYYDRLFRINDATTRKRADDYNVYIRYQVVRVAGV